MSINVGINVGINGFGRIGRSILRAVYENGLQNEIKIIAINELASPDGIAHLLKYDSSHGRFGHDVKLNGNTLSVDGNLIELSCEKEIESLPWKKLGVDLVMDCTGFFHSRKDAEQHIKSGAKKVLFSQPADNDVDNTIIYGVNDNSLEFNHRIVSNGSCTTNCIVPVIDVLDKAFSVDTGTITTIHSSMHDQQVIDAYHSDLRRTRAASQSIIPVDTKLAQGVERILPKFSGRFEAIAVRVPTINVTAMDLSVTVNCDVTIESVNNAFKEYVVGPLKDILDYTEEPLVSIDFNHDPHSCIVDGNQTRVSHKHLIKVLVWCDNEWGFANRMLDTAAAMMNFPE